MTAAGVECLSSYAVPVPMLDDPILAAVMARDHHKIGQADYGQAWSGGETMAVSDAPCTQCADCPAEQMCPTSAILREDGEAIIGRTRCVNCGACVAACGQGRFKGDLGEVSAEVNGTARTVPTACRGSDREGAVRTMENLKRRLLDGSFAMTAKVAGLRP